MSPRVPEPLVRSTTTWRFTYRRPRVNGWPLLRIESSFNNTGYVMEPLRVVVTVVGGKIARTISRVAVHGRWLDGGADCNEQLDLPGKRHGHTVAPNWVVEITDDALDRSLTS